MAEEGLVSGRIVCRGQMERALKDYVSESGLDPLGIWEPLNNLNQTIVIIRFLFNEE